MASKRFIPTDERPTQFTYCTIRQDLRNSDLSIPVGTKSLPCSMKGQLRYKWEDGKFYIFFKRWKEAQSIDFDF